MTQNKRSITAQHRAHLDDQRHELVRNVGRQIAAVVATDEHLALDIHDIHRRRRHLRAPEQCHWRRLQQHSTVMIACLALPRNHCAAAAISSIKEKTNKGQRMTTRGKERVSERTEKKEMGKRKIKGQQRDTTTSKWRVEESEK